MPWNTPPEQTQWLVYRLGHLGDVVLSTGVLAHLHASRGWTFCVATGKGYGSLFSGLPGVRAVEEIGPQDTGSAANFAVRCKSLARTYAGWGLLDLHGSLRSRMLSWFWRGPVRRYPKSGLRRRLFLLSGKRVCGPALRVHSIAQRYYMAVCNPPPPAGELLPHIALAATERAWAQDRIESLFGPGACPVAFHPHATHALKTWPEEHWLRLAQLADSRKLPWISLGRGKALFADRSNELSNKTSLRESCALLSRCRVLLSGDSGPMHLAGAVGTPVIALFGPTTREWGFYPQGPQDIILERELPCRPCSLHGRKPCPRMGQCLAAITPEEVFAALQAPPPRRSAASAPSAP
ncbi:glycosyltransferase family 9 protein [Desulfovibrio sp. OttesenSCG-928-A18]|nr:glycosyltransferase family 9 protein [Desulfovibrio sp. OttesenSCG-928-A18]